MGPTSHRARRARCRDCTGAPHAHEHDVGHQPAGLARGVLAGDQPRPVAELVAGDDKLRDDLGRERLRTRRCVPCGRTRRSGCSRWLDTHACRGPGRGCRRTRSRRRGCGRACRSAPCARAICGCRRARPAGSPPRACRACRRGRGPPSAPCRHWSSPRNRWRAEVDPMQIWPARMRLSRSVTPMARSFSFSSARVRPTSETGRRAVLGLDVRALLDRRGNGAGRAPGGVERRRRHGSMICSRRGYAALYTRSRRETRMAAQGRGEAVLRMAEGTPRRAALGAARPVVGSWGASRSCRGIFAGLSFGVLTGDWGGRRHAAHRRRPQQRPVAEPSSEAAHSLNIASEPSRCG